MAWPTRMGLVSIHKALRQVCAWIVFFRPKWDGRLTPEQIALMDDLMVCCEAVIDNVPQYEPE